MSDFFRKFPLISYNGIQVRDISRRIALKIKSLQDPLVFLPYTVKDGEKPEDVAYYYYGSVDYTWLVLLSNNLLDPYIDWPIETSQFTKYFIEKYKEISGETDYEVIAWAQNELSSENVVFYYKNTDTSVVKVAASTFPSVSAATLEGWTPMRLWDYEFALNEEKRNIQLVDVAYRDKIDAEFRKLILK